MKRQMLCMFLLFAAALGAAGQKDSPAEQLAAVFNAMRGEKNARVASVKYTGGDFEKAGGGFMWQNNDGRGWTTGERLTLTDVRPKQLERVAKCFDRVAQRQHVTGRAYQPGKRAERCTGVNGNRKVYVYRYDPEPNVLYLLQATPGEGCCVPKNWYLKDSVNATVTRKQTDPFAHLSATERRLLGLSRLWAGVKQNFVFLSQVGLNWDSLYAAQIKRVMQAPDDAACTRIFQEMTALLHDGHTYVYDFSARAAVPLSTRYIDGHVYVDAVADRGLQRAGVERGMELLRMNGQPVMDYGRLRVMPAVAASTPQWALHETYDGAGLMACGPTDTVRLELANRSGRRVEVRYTPAAREPIDLPRQQVTWKRLKGRIGYLRIRHFGQHPELLDEIYPELLKTRALIIDLRDNPGGNSGYANYVLQRLATDSFRLASWSSPLYVPAWASWGYGQQWHREPSQWMQPTRRVTPYTGPVVVLIDRGTFSAAEDFCAVFKGMKRGIFVGTPTGGSTGNGVRVELIPGFSYANICSKHDVGPDGTDFVGKGIQPDIWVDETYASWFEDKTDAALTAALKYLEQRAAAD